MPPCTQNGAGIDGAQDDDEPIVPVLDEVVDDPALQLERHDFEQKYADGQQQAGTAGANRSFPEHSGICCGAFRPHRSQGLGSEPTLVRHFARFSRWPSQPPRPCLRQSGRASNAVSVTTACLCPSATVGLGRRSH